MKTASPSEQTSSAACQTGRIHGDCGHVVHFYKTDAFLLDVLGRSVQAALSTGQPVVYIGTKDHLKGLSCWFHSRGVNLGEYIEGGRYIPLDARETLSTFMRDGMPDAAQFASSIGGVLDRAGAGGQTVAAIGEMVAVLCAEGHWEATIRLEELWNELATTHHFSLICAYPLDSFSGAERTEAFVRVCAQHSAVMPAEDYSSLTGEDERLRRVAVLQQKAEALEREVMLRRSEERFRLLMESATDYAIFILDPQGRIVSWNGGAGLGYQIAEVVGQKVSCFYSEEDARAGRPEENLQFAAAQGRFEGHGWRVRSDGSRFWANAIITALRDSRGTLIGFAKVVRDMTERKIAEEALQAVQKETADSEQALRQLSLHLLRSQDEERRSIGAALHDSVGQYLSVLKMNLDRLALPPAAGAPARAEPTPRNELAACSTLADQSIEQVRRISYLLYPPMLEETGLKSAVPWYLDDFRARTGIEASFKITSDFGRLSREAEVALFRVMQEALTNVQRHSGSASVGVQLFNRAGVVALTVADRGVGMPAETCGKSGQDWLRAVGIGLRGMNERMRQLGGKLEMASTTKGTTITATLPSIRP